MYDIENNIPYIPKIDENVLVKQNKDKGFIHVSNAIIIINILLKLCTVAYLH